MDDYAFIWMIAIAVFAVKMCLIGGCLYARYRRMNYITRTNNVIVTTPGVQVAGMPAYPTSPYVQTGNVKQFEQLPNINNIPQPAPSYDETMRAQQNGDMRQYEQLSQPSTILPPAPSYAEAMKAPQV